MPSSPQKDGQNRRRSHDLLVQQIVLALSQTGICRVWEQPTGAAYRDGALVRYGVIGSADISGILVGGKRLEIEVKTGRAVQEPRQVKFMNMIRAMGGHYFVARSIDDAVKAVYSFAKIGQNVVKDGDHK